ncbi:unnamed protein product, partial [Prorocentrum cordatum]
AALRLRAEFQDLGIAVFDGSILDSLWEEASLQTDMGYNLMAMIEQLAVEHAMGDPQASKLKWGECTELTFERQGSIAHERPMSWETGDWALKPITIDDIKLVARKFPNATRMGWSNFHPRLLLEVGDDALFRLASLLNSCGRNPHCGELWAIIMVPRPKPDVGQRPIRPMPMLARIWSRMRLRECAKWERPIDQQAFWGNSSSRGCDEAARLHDIFAAHAKPPLEAAGSFYADLSNYYEHIGHCELKVAAQARGFDVWLLRALRCTYRAPRRARVGTCLSDAVAANGAVVAGCSCAAALAKLLLISALRAAALAAPVAGVLNVVDDVSCHAAGPCTMVAQQLAAAYRAFCAKMEDANLPLSRNKTKALATSSKLRDALKSQPGWDIAEGDFVGRSTPREEANRTVQALDQSSEGLQSRPLCESLFGSAIMVVPSGRLRRLRVGATRARGRLARGAALGLASLGQSGGWKRGPLAIVAKTALMAYVEMVWAPLLPEAAARYCLAAGLVIAERLRPWRLVKVPISALVLALERAVWVFISGDPYRLHDALGHEYREVKRHGSSTRGWGAPPFWQPILDLASHRSEVWDLRRQRALRCLIQNTYWRFRCEARDGWRREFLEPPLRGAAARVELMGYPFTELFARGLFLDISELVQIPPRTDDLFKRATSWTAGWSISVFDKHRKLAAEAWGSVPESEGPEQVARDGEDYAVKVLADTIAWGSFKLRCDCLATVRCAAGPLAAAAAGSQRSHLWAGRAERLKDAEVIEVRAYLGPQAVKEGLITQFELDGNAMADARAEEGAAAVRADSNDIHCVEGGQFIARFAARCAAAQGGHIAGSGLRDSMGVKALEIVDLDEWPADPAGACE